jgi:hypothetical protein
VAVAVISAVQKYSFGVRIKNKTKVLKNFYVVYFPSYRPGKLSLPLVS